MVLCDLALLAHISASVVAVPPKEMPTRVTDPRCPHSNETPAFKMTPGPCFDSIFKTGLVLLLKDYFDQQSDKGKNKVPNDLKLLSMVSKLLHAN